MSTSFFGGLESFMEENPVEATATVTIQPEDQVEIQQDIADAKEDAADAENRIEKSEQLICQLSAMYEHVKKYGVDRTFLSMFNNNGELASIIKREIPSCEAFDAANVMELSQICCEGINSALERFILTLRDDILKQYTAIRRAFQSWTSDAKDAKNTLLQLKSQLKAVKSLPDSTIKAYNVSEFKKWVSIKPDILRKNALDALHEMQDWSFSKGSNENGAEIADDLEKDIETIEKAEPEKFEIQLSSWSINELNAAVDYCIRACDSINIADDSYEGWWKTGFNQGKLKALFGEWLSGNPIAIGVTALRQNVVRVARTSWRNMNTLCSIDDAVIHTVIRMAKAAVNQ